MMLRYFFLILGFLFSGITLVTAQQSRESFGKNRIQYREFEWQYLSGENFDVYYYDNRRGVATEAMEYLESEFDRITDLVGYPPYFKTKVFIYNSLNDLRQSNVGLNHNIYYVGGETEFVKPYVEVAHMGTIQEFKEELLYRISDLIINEMMYGGSLRDVFQNSLLMNLPDWFVNGAALYAAHGWSEEMDDFVRQLAKTKRMKKLARYTGHEAGLIGQSIWNYIAEKYGKSSISNILNYTRITRNEERSISITLGVSYSKLIDDWALFYAQQEATTSKSYISAPDSLRISPRHNITTEFTTIKISPDGRYLAYAENDRGRYIVKVKSLESGKEITILTHGSKVISQRVDYRTPILSWSDANTLGVIAVKQGQYTFWLYDLTTNTKLPRQLDRFSNVRSLSFSGNGRLAVVSADFEGQNDLFLISTRRDRVRRLTNDIYDDLDPSFIPGSNRIVFSSNRETDTLKVGEKANYSSLTYNYNLFVFDLDTTTNVTQRITNTLSKDYAPIALNDNVFYYLSDQRGIVNMFKYDRSTGIYTQVTNLSGSIKEYDFNPTTNTLALVLKRKMKDEIYLDRNFNLNRQVFTPATRRKELQQVRVIRERKKQEQENQNMSLKDLINARLKETQAKSDTIPTDSLKKASNDSVAVKKDSVIVTQQPVKKPDVVNTDNYTFEDEAVKETQPSESFLTRYMKARDKSRVMGPFPYESKFSSNSIITSPVIDPMRGFGFLLETQMNDMLENYRFFGGLMTTADFRSGDFYAEFQYLPKRMDYNIRFDRKAIRWEPFTNSKGYKYNLNRVEFGASLPIIDRARITVKPFGALARSVYIGTLNASAPPSEEPINNFYAGIRSEIVYDNSIITGLNIIEGTRGKIFYQHYQGLNDASKSFSQVSADLRHYQKLYKEITIAFRGFAGMFFGNSPKQYLLGGMDNWAFNDTQFFGNTGNGEENPLGVNDENQDLLFVEYVTSLRGFDYATLFGNKALLFNAELRVPLVRALTNEPIASNFFRNLQFVAFYDIGTSWSGAAPFGDQISVSFERYKSGSVQIDIKNYLNPWLYSYGLGMRTVMFGYYVKIDAAWPVINYQVQDTRWHITLGFDF